MPLPSYGIRERLPSGIEYPYHRRIIARCANELATVQGGNHSCLSRDARASKKELAKLPPRLWLEPLLAGVAKRIDEVGGTERDNFLRRPFHTLLADAKWNSSCGVNRQSRGNRDDQDACADARSDSDNC